MNMKFSAGALAVSLLTISVFMGPFVGAGVGITGRGGHTRESPGRHVSFSNCSLPIFVPSLSFEKAPSGHCSQLLSS